MGIGHILYMLIVGLVVGAIAWFFMPGPEPLGIFGVALVGIAGSFVGGIISHFFSRRQPGEPIRPAGFFMSVIGAMIVLFLWQRIR